MATARRCACSRPTRSRGSPRTGPAPCRRGKAVRTAPHLLEGQAAGQVRGGEQGDHRGVVHVGVEREAWRGTLVEMRGGIVYSSLFPRPSQRECPPQPLPRHLHERPPCDHLAPLLVLGQQLVPRGGVWRFWQPLQARRVLGRSLDSRETFSAVSTHTSLQSPLPRPRHLLRDGPTVETRPARAGGWVGRSASILATLLVPLPRLLKRWTSASGPAPPASQQGEAGGAASLDRLLDLVPLALLVAGVQVCSLGRLCHRLRKG